MAAIGPGDPPHRPLLQKSYPYCKPKGWFSQLRDRSGAQKTRLSPGLALFRAFRPKNKGVRAPGNRGEAARRPGAQLFWTPARPPELGPVRVRHL